jgi:hypothetical protein
MVLHGRSFWAPAQTLVGQQSLPCAHTRKPLLRSINSIRAVLLAFLVTALVVAVEPSGLGQMDAGSAISGQVLNALTGQPVSRALVRLDGQAVLADHEGKFEISGVTREIISIQVTKPGFYERLEPGRGNLGQQIKVTTLSGPVVIRLYPEALITGTVTAPSGDPIPQVLVEALRSTVDESGQRWTSAGRTPTDSRGNFRLPVAPGDYAIEVPYLPQNRDLKEAILPVVYPPIGSSIGLSTVHIASGTEQHLDLHPDIRSTHVVRLRVEADNAQGVPQLEARSSRSQLAMTLETPFAGAAGEVSTDLPSGSYTVAGTLTGPGGTEHADTNVTVGDHDVSGAVLRFQHVSSVPVQVIVDSVAPASTSDAMTDTSPPSPQQLGLFLHSSDATPNLRQPDYPVQSSSNEPAGFRAPPGHYRIYARSGGPWYVKSISIGGTDLLSQDLVIAAGTAGEVVQVVVSNQTALLTGVLKLDGKPASATIWLISNGASASPLIELRSSIEGNFNRAHLAPGSYLAIGFENSPSGNLLDPAVQTNYASYTKAFQVAAGETENLDLDAVPAAELQP